MSGQLERLWLGDEAAYVAAGDVDWGGAAAAPVLLVPYFDAYVVGGHPRDLLFPGSVGERALAHGQAGTFPVLLVDGTAAGVWHCRRTGGTIDVTVEPVVALSSGQRAEVAAQADRVGRISQARARLTVGKVTMGPHA